MARIRTVVTALNLITPLGLTSEDTWNGLLQARSTAQLISQFDASAYPSKIACELPSEYDVLENHYCGNRFLRQSIRFTRMGLVATKRLQETYQIPFESLDRRRIGVSMGVSGAGVDGGHKGEQWEVLRSMINALPAWISLEYGLKGPSIALSSACATSADAIAQAYRLIQSGEADMVITGGADAPIIERVVAGFNSVVAMSTRNDDPTSASRPFDRDRDGFVLGEGAAILVVESLEHALRRGATVLAELKGFSSLCEANNMMAPMKGGVEMARVMSQAIANAGLTPADVDYVSAHGTSTKYNDLAEGNAMKLVFGERVGDVPISSQKSMIGHAMGACGAIECGITVLSIRHQWVTPTINHHTLDAELEGLDVVPNIARPQQIRNALCNSFAFGGHNTCLVFGNYPEFGDLDHV